MNNVIDIRPKLRQRQRKRISKKAEADVRYFIAALEELALKEIHEDVLYFPSEDKELNKTIDDILIELEAKHS